MKNLRIIIKGAKLRNHIIIFLLILASCVLSLEPAYSLQTTNTLTVMVNVQAAFELIVNSDSFDFARLMPGQTGEIARAEGIVVTGASSGGNPWYLKVSAVKPLSSGSDFISNENFSWYSSTEGKGESFGSAEKSFSDPSSTAYISSLDEANSSEKVVNKFKFKLFVPEETKAGYYTTTVMFTMTE